MAKFVYAFLALGFAFALGQQIPQVPQHTDPAVLNYNPFVNPNVPGTGSHHQSFLPTPPPPQAGIPPVPQHTDPKVLNYNPFINPNLNSHPTHHQPPTPHHPPTPQNSGYNPFKNPHVPDHLYQQHQQQPQRYNPAPAVAPASHYNHPNAAPQVAQVPQHTDPAVTNYNPFYNKDTAGFNPFFNPNVPEGTYSGPNSGRQQYQPTPAPAPQPGNYPGSFGPAGSSPFGFSHPNSIPGTNNYNKGGRGPVKVSVSQQPQGFTYNFETS